jgi:cytochrome c biogenesis protein
MRESTLNLLRALASLKLTLLGIVSLLAGVLLAYFSPDRNSAPIVLPLALLALNLLAAIIWNRRIRQNSGLLMFHLCLLMIAVLTLLSQLTSMKGRVEVTQGAAYDATGVAVVEQGAWHGFDQLREVTFIQGDVQVEYAAGLRREATRSQLMLADGNTITVGDNVPFKSHGYRFYTTSNKGFAAIINWRSKDGGIEQGAIHFPSYPLYDWKQSNQWQAPSGQQLGFQLLIDARLDRDRDWLLQNNNQGQLVITLPDGARHEIEPGEYIELENGTLEFEAISMWMGYKIFYDPFLAWFLAASLVGVAGIAWHYYLKLSSQTTRRALVVQRAGRGRVVSTTQS